MRIQDKRKIIPYQMLIFILFMKKEKMRNEINLCDGYAHKKLHRCYLIAYWCSALADILMSRRSTLLNENWVYSSQLWKSMWLVSLKHKAALAILP